MLATQLMLAPPDVGLITVLVGAWLFAVVSSFMILVVDV